MSEEENTSVENQDSQGVAGAVESEIQHDDVSSAQENSASKRNDAEYNWAEMRRQMREKDLQIQELREQFSHLAQRPPTKEEQDELATLAEDDILTVKQARKLAEKMAQKVASDVLRQRDASTAEERAQLKYPDFNEVVSKENIEYLKETKPRLAKSLASMTDPYEQALAAYELLKEMGKPKTPSLEKRKAEANSQKPVSVNAITNASPIGKASMFENGLTPELKQQLWKEMQTAMKSA